MQMLILESLNFYNRQLNDNGIASREETVAPVITEEIKGGL